MIGLVGTVRKWKGNRGTISVRGEIWAAMDPQSDFPLSRDDEVEIVDVRGLTLEIRALPPKPLKL
jgi:membrane-bound ClpP family serine protease